MPRELQKTTSTHQEHGILEPADARLVFPWCWHLVSRADPPAVPRFDALHGLDAVRYLRDVCVCTGGDSFSDSCVDTSIFVFRRPTIARWSAQCSRIAQMRRSDFAASSYTWLTVPCVHESVLFCQQRPYHRMSSRMLQRLRRAALGCVPCVLLVSCFVLPARAHAKRCRKHPRSGSSVTCSGAKSSEFLCAVLEFSGR